MPVSAHLVIPFAACASPAWLPTLGALSADHLRCTRQLLQGMQPVAESAGDAASLSPPHERVLAAALGLVDPNGGADGVIPWAAHAAQQAGWAPGQAWAWITPCHWAMGREHATLTDPAGLDMTDGEAQTLRDAMQPYFTTEGIVLHAHTPGRWLAEGSVFEQLPTASLDRVLGRNVDAWLPGTSTAGSLRRLQNEMQMLLYTHPLNDARSALGQRTINSFWLSGTGALPPLTAATTDVAATVTAPRTLANAVFADDWDAYAAAWAALDAGEVAALLARQDAGETVQLTLCGERHAHTYASAPASLVRRISNFLKPQPLIPLLEQL